MIEGISSNLESFKHLEFKPGLNIILAERSKKRSNTHSLNGVGKSSFVELVHFLLGAHLSNDSIFNRSELKKREFSLVIDVNGEKIEVTRGGEKQKSIILNGKFDHIFSESVSSDLFDYCKISIDQWQAELRKLWFQLPIVENENVPTNPNFRSLISYFARRQNENGFNDFKEYSKKQQNWSKQVSLSFLLGLDWQLSAQLEEVKKKEYLFDDEAETIQKVKSGQKFNEATEIESQLASIKEKQKDLTETLKTFKVEPQYQEYLIEVTKITKQIDTLNSKNIL